MKHSVYETITCNCRLSLSLRERDRDRKQRERQTDRERQRQTDREMKSQEPRVPYGKKVDRQEIMFNHLVVYSDLKSMD